jgi:hypothetical protein
MFVANQGKKPLLRYRHRWEDTFKKDREGRAVNLNEPADHRSRDGLL